MRGPERTEKSWKAFQVTMEYPHQDEMGRYFEEPIGTNELEIPSSLGITFVAEKGGVDVAPDVLQWCQENIKGRVRFYQPLMQRMISMMLEMHSVTNPASVTVTCRADFPSVKDAVAFKLRWWP